MMEFEFIKGRIVSEFNKGYEVVIPIDKTLIEPLNDLLTDDKVKVIQIDHKRQKRSLNSNNYAWSLISQIADILRTSKEEVYLTMLKRYGQSSVVSVNENAAEVFKKSVKYYEEFGNSVLNGKNFVHFKVYVGSSEFDSRAMSVFMDGVISEANELKIPTMTPKELLKLKVEWRIDE